MRGKFAGTAIVIVLMVCSAVGQSTFGSIVGVVHDKTQAVVPGASVQIRSLEDNSTRSTTSDQNGSFEFVNLKAGKYAVSVQAPEFADSQIPLAELTARQTLRVDVTMNIKSQTETVEVSDTVATVNTENGVIADSKDSRDIGRLPLNFRAVTTSPLAALATSANVQQDSQGNIALAGATANMVGYSVDGISTANVFQSEGVLNSENPMRDVVLPKAKPCGETYAYSLEEITQMLNVLSEPAATIVAAAAFTGARKGELRGFLWESYDGERIFISQSFWRGHAQPPKTKHSSAPVPVIAQLANRLDGHRMLSGNPEYGLMFPSPGGTAVNLDALVVNVIRPALRNAGLSWRGWHAFRRGLATTLHRLRVPDKTIQAVLRHSNVAVTQGCYIKTVSDDVAAAMRSLEYAPHMHLESERKPRVM
jgi:hypothetical protein